MDLTTEKPSGGLWDLSREADRRQELRHLQDREWPEILTGSPPCTTFCPLLYIKFTKEQIQQRRDEEGEPHIRFCVERYRRQLELDRHFLHMHEHPEGSASFLGRCPRWWSPSTTRGGFWSKVRCAVGA